MFFQVEAFGKVERDPELHITKDGTPFTEFSLAVNKKRCVEDITIWLACYAWGDQAETIKRTVTESRVGKPRCIDAGDEPPLLVWGGERSSCSGKEMLDPDGKGCYT